VESISSSIIGRPRTPTDGGPGSHGWQGLSRYLDESEQDDKARWSNIEYATVSTIVDSPEASMSFYWDVVGIVPDKTFKPMLREEKKLRTSMAIFPQNGGSICS
jgi:hypothetical protein